MSDTATGAGDGSTAQGEGSATDTTTNRTTETATDDRPLGSAGEKALEEWKTRARSAESALKETKSASKERDQALARLAEYEEASKSEQEKALDKARKEALAQGKSESDAAWAARVVKTDVRAAAREKFADPSDALAFLDLSQIKVDEDGNTDEKAITGALDALLKDKPHLGKSQPKSTTGSADQGARGTGTASADMNTILRRKIAGI